MTVPQKRASKQELDAVAASGKRFVRASATALAFGLATAALFAALHLFASRPSAPAEAAEVRPPRADSAGPNLARVTARAGQALALPQELNVDALSAVVSKKYRVSYVATRSMIDMAYREARQNGLDPMLLVAVMAVESRFNPIAQSDSGAMGLMQVIPRFHPDKFSDDGTKSILDPRVNIELGAKVLREYIRRGGTEVAGLQLYNGSANDLTTTYADKVIAERQRLHEALQRARTRA
jgi:soluble lytic murein transglycosylase-like protein